MPEIFAILHEMNELVIAYPSHEQWTDLGRLEDLAKLEEKSQDSSQDDNETN